MHLPKPGGGGDFTPVRGGSYPALCYRVIDLGTQREVYQGEEKRQRKVLLGWELKDEDCRMDDGRPMVISKRYTLSMHEKATLRKDLESWRGQAFLDSEFGPGGFDVRKLLGKPCLLTVANNAGKDGKTYAKVTGVSPVPKAMRGAIGELENAQLYFSLDEFDADAFGQLSQYWQGLIKASPEFRDAVEGRPPLGADEDHQGGRWAQQEEEIPF